MTIVIAGCGDLGTAAGQLFAAGGHRVVGIRRSTDALPPPLETQSVDLRSGRPEIPRDTTAVVVALTAGERSPEAYRATYLGGLANVLDSVEASGASPFVLLVSSTAVYDVTDGSWVDERTPALATSPTAAVLRETEVLLADRAERSCALRLGGIYGPGRTRLIDQVRKGHASVPAQSLFTNRIHRDDAARAIVHLVGLGSQADDGSGPPPLVLGVDDEPAQLGDVLRFIAGELGVDLRVEAPSRGEAASREGGGDKRCSNALLHSTGFDMRYPSFREGYRELLASARR